MIKLTPAKFRFIMIMMFAIMVLAKCQEADWGGGY